MDVTHDKRLVGIITDGDLRRAVGPNIMQQTPAGIMAPDPFAAFSRRKIGNAFIVEGDDIVGLLDLKTLLATGNV